MSDDYARQRRIQDDIGFKTAAFVAGMMHYFSLVFTLNILTNLAGQVKMVLDMEPSLLRGVFNLPANLMFLPEARRSIMALAVILAVSGVVFAGLVIYCRLVFRYGHWTRALGRVLLHEAFPFTLCLVLDLLT
ncbi:MAG: hypothetical protein ABIF71_12515 [Planctomycetota bacterium]